MKHLVSLVSINPLSPSQVMQGAWSGKATRLGMIKWAWEPNPIREPPMMLPNQFPQVTSDITTKSLGHLGYQVLHASVAEAGSPQLSH